MRKIAFYIESMVLGGAEKVLVDIVNHLDPSLFDITIVSIYKESVYPTAMTYDLTPLVNDNVHIIKLIDNSNRFLYRLFNHLYAHTNKSVLYSILIRDKYDIEVAFYEGFPTEFVAHSTNRHSIKYAWLHTNNDRLYKDKTKHYLEKIHDIYNKYDCVISVSENTRISFFRYFPDIPCITILNGIDITEVKRKAKEKCNMERTGKTTFVTVGRIVPIKGYDRLLKACKDLLQDGYRFSLLMIGDGSEKNALEEYIHHNQLDDVVFMLSKQDNPYKYFKICDAYICSSFFEGLSLSIIEAMACGLPILSTDYPGIRELCIGNDGWNICDNSKEGIKQVLKKALDDPKKLIDLSSLSIEQSKQFDIKRQIQIIQDLFLNGASV